MGLFAMASWGSRSPEPLISIVRGFRDLGFLWLSGCEESYFLEELYVCGHLVCTWV